MLEQGYSPNGRDANGWTLLHFSAARGKERCVRVFLEHGGELPAANLFFFPQEETLNEIMFSLKCVCVCM
jgi:ankyrin repeat protein